MRKPRKIKLGKVKPWTDEELDKLSEITDQDKEEAAARWHKHAGRLARLLDAEEKTDAADKPANA